MNNLKWAFVAVALSGSLLSTTPAAAYISASPSFVSFPDTPVNGIGSSRSVTVRNNSNETVEGLNIYDNCFGDFQVSNYGCYGRLGPYGSCSLNVQYRPISEGYRSCSIQINGSGSYESVSISGRGVRRLGVDESAPMDAETEAAGTAAEEASEPISVGPWHETKSSADQTP